MTTITLAHDYDEYRITASEHADSERVCAGVSALLYSIAGWVENNRERFHASIVKLNGGDAEIYFEGGGYVAQAVYEVAVIGFLQIAQSYPDFIRVKM